MLWRLSFIVIVVFMLGWMSHGVYSGENDLVRFERPFATKNEDVIGYLSNKEIPSPQDRIDESQIHVYEDRIVLDISNAEWSRFTDTNSMDPIIDKGANAIHIVPKTPDEINIGDIVAYESDYADGTLIHRIVSVSADENGIYYTLKGDNNPSPDPGKVRFNQIRRVLVGIIY